MTNYKMIIQYDGSRYKGWQVQGNTEQTIQGKIEAVLKKMTGDKVEINGSGRTDAGVHAMGQVANVKLKNDYPCKKVMEYLNTYLPEDIAVLKVTAEDERFHARLSAVEKTYQYRIWTSSVPNVFERKYVETIEEPLNVNQMRRAAFAFTGEHDFTSLCGNRHMKKSAVRTIYDIRIEELDHEIRISVCGNGFLQNMVRILVGTLVEVGLGKRDPQDMTGILEAKNRDMAGITMPAKGLMLMEVKYE